MMKIISGKYKGRLLSVPKNIRPTMNNIRESVFNVIVNYVIDANVLDLFAGCGSFGIEALSRGAGGVCFVDNSKKSCDLIRNNLSQLKLAVDEKEKISIFIKDSLKAIKFFHNERKTFDIIFLDPPYSKGWLRKCLKCLSIYDILQNSGLIIVEHFKKDELPEDLGNLKLVRGLRYGDTSISIFKKDISSSGSF